MKTRNVYDMAVGLAAGLVLGYKGPVWAENVLDHLKVLNHRTNHEIALG